MAACSAPGHAVDRDLWWLVNATESEVPLTVAKVERLLGTSLHPVTDAATTANTDRQEFTYFGVDVGGCIPLDDALARHPGLVPKYMPSGHSDAEDEVWAVARDWGGELMFGVNPKTRCLQGFSLQQP